MDKREFRRLIRISPLWKLVGVIRYYSKRYKVDSVINKFEQQVSEKRRSELRRKMFWAMVRYYWDFDEFFLFGYETLSPKERMAFVPEYEKNVFCDKVNDARTADIFYDKWQTYSLFGKRFFQRDVVYIKEPTDIDVNDVREFLAKHDSFIIKPTTQACGRGISIIRQKKGESNKEELFYKLKNGYCPCVIEELIEQDDTMASFHPTSVNTVRIPTFRYDDETVIIHPFMRIGQGGSVVDNAGHGGIICNCDVKTGKVIAACDEKGIQYSYHPDTKKQILGFEVPKWKEAVAFAKQLADVLPQVRYVGWDLALTAKGWVMIEGNDKGQFVFQYPSREGFRADFKKIIERWKRNKQVVTDK